MAAMKPASLDYLNIGLMVISLFAAFAVPFELFLFSYAVLGPLHYFTEIGWLHTKNYYTSGKYDYLFLVSFAAASLAGHFVPALQFFLPTIIYSAFLASLALIFIQSVPIKVFAVAAISFISLLLLNNLFYLAIFIPSIIHVYFFTGAFMLFGALKSRSIPGLVSVAVLFLSAALCFLLVRNAHLWRVSTFEQVTNTLKCCILRLPNFYDLNRWQTPATSITLS